MKKDGLLWLLSLWSILFLWLILCRINCQSFNYNKNTLRAVDKSSFEETRINYIADLTFLINVGSLSGKMMIANRECLLCMSASVGLLTTTGIIPLQRRYWDTLVSSCCSSGGRAIMHSSESQTWEIRNCVRHEKMFVLQFSCNFQWS